MCLNCSISFKSRFSIRYISYKTCSHTVTTAKHELELRNFVEYLKNILKTKELTWLMLRRLQRLGRKNLKIHKRENGSPKIKVAILHQYSNSRQSLLVYYFVHLSIVNYDYWRKIKNTKKNCIYLQYQQILTRVSWKQNFLTCHWCKNIPFKTFKSERKFLTNKIPRPTTNIILNNYFKFLST